MSNICDNNATESSTSTENTAPKNKYELSPGLRDKLTDIPEALQFIELLERYIKKQRRKLKKIKAKLKRIPKLQDACTQTESDNSTKTFAEEITEAAELATQSTGFVYDENTGMYYDSKTGYYYSSEYGLYYDANTGTYLSYKQDTDTYEFHSQVTLPQKRKKKEAKAAGAAKCVKTAEAEEGECSMTSSSGNEETSDDSIDLSKQWPPCMRIIVEQSQSPKIKTGSLHIVTFEGGTLGREGSHAIILPDINISKTHLQFSYSREKNLYLAKDLGSRNGTILNGKRMSESKLESEVLEVPHGSRIQMGSVVLLCHVHEGYKTCGLCEPGLVQTVEKPASSVASKSKSELHKSELKKLRKKFGVSAFDEGNTKLAAGYTDRAQQRRKTVGSQNDNEKTQVASLEESISSQNKGFKMLAKMGWKEGQSLGKEGQGMLEPISVVGNSGKSGVGSEEKKPDVAFDKSKIIWKKAQERFNKLPTQSNVFEDEED